MDETAVRHLVIACLGNPGRQYELTRHNFGYLVGKALAASLGWKWTEERQFNAFLARGKIGNCKVDLLLPTTYMNESGRAVRGVLDYYKLTPVNLVVVSDDIALPFGEVRVRSVGGPGGHNGLRSIQTHLGTRDYIRLRLGVGPFKLGTLADFVLAPFDQGERERIPEILDKACKILLRVIQEPIAQVMNEVNTKLTSSRPQEEGQEKKHERNETKSL